MLGTEDTKPKINIQSLLSKISVSRLVACNVCLGRVPIALKVRGRVVRKMSRKEEVTPEWNPKHV